MSGTGLHYPPVRQAECQPGSLAGCGKVNVGGKTSYCVTPEREQNGSGGEGLPSVSSGLPYPQSKWTRAARGEATDTHGAKPTEHNTEAWTDRDPANAEQSTEMDLDAAAKHRDSAGTVVCT